MVGSISPVLSESFDDVLHAVQETARGRWFLDEYAKRKKAEDTTVILAAIVKLESAIARMPEPTQDSEHAALEKAKTAIARAKAQIKNLSPEGSPLSEEAQLFARLAELSRKAHSAETAEGVRETISRGVEVALKLVSELDAELGSDTKPVTPKSQKYFNQDSNLFEPAAKPAIATKSEFIPPEIHAKPVPPALPSNPDPVQRGAKLTINRPSSATVDTPEIEPTQSKADKPAEQRIVIIRRSADETIDVPLLDKQDDANAA
jgi:hypothetical protein